MLGGAGLDGIGGRTEIKQGLQPRPRITCMLKKMKDFAPGGKKRKTKISSLTLVKDTTK